MFEIFIAILAFSFLIIIHELGHFILAKRFGVKIEEFGLGLPPRLFGKKIGETLFSLNLIPFGGFVKMYGEERDIKDPRSFTGKSIWQRTLIIAGGLIAFWIIAAILLTIVFGLGAPTALSDEENGNLINPKVQIIAVASNSPAEKAGLKMEDVIVNLKFQILKIKTDKVKEVHEFIETHKGKEITLTIQRGKDIFDVSLIPRVEPPKDEGAMGVALVRTAIKAYPWYQAPFRGILATGNLTIAMIQGWGGILRSLLKGEGMPSGVKIVGPVEIFAKIGESIRLGLVNLLSFIAIISIALALFNILPIPALDGGKLLFLGIEAVRRKPVSQKIEQNITVAFFMILIALMILVTIKDIARRFLT